MNDSDTKSQAASGYSPLSGPDSATQADVNRPLLTENSNPRPTLSLPSAPTTLFTIPKTLLTARTLNTRRTLTLPFASRPSGLTTLSLLEAPRTLLPSYQIESQATAGSPRRSDSNSSRLSDTDSPRHFPFRAPVVFLLLPGMTKKFLVILFSEPKLLFLPMPKPGQSSWRYQTALSNG